MLHEGSLLVEASASPEIVCADPSICYSAGCPPFAGRDRRQVAAPASSRAAEGATHEAVLLQQRPQVWQVLDRNHQAHVTSKP